jgi:Electron transfer DM13
MHHRWARADRESAAPRELEEGMMRASYRQRLGAALMAGLLAVSAVGGTTPASASRPAAATLERAEPIMVASGQFGEIDLIHKGVGTATVWQLPDGARVLRFEDFGVTNGPDLYVYLSGHPAPRDSGQLHEGAAFEVARLKGNVGNQNYELPADLDLSGFSSVVIYCKAFSTVFSTAALASAV